MFFFATQVPIFDPCADSYESVHSRSSVLFDIIVSYGARAAHGPMSEAYRAMHSLLRQHTSDLVLRLSGSSVASVEDVQALLVMASYSETGSTLVDIALNAANRIGLRGDLESLLATSLDTGPAYSAGMCCTAKKKSSHTLIAI